MSDLYTKLVAGFIFPIHEHFKHHSTVSIRKQMEESQWWPRDRLEAFQLERLFCLLDKAEKNVPYYRELFASLGKGWTAYEAAQKKVVGLGRDKKQQDAADISDGLASMAFDETIGSLEALSKYNFEGGQQAAEHVDAVFVQARAAVIGALGVTLVLGIAMGTLISRRLLRQLGGEPREAAAVARAVADGDLSSEIRVRSGDRDSVMACLAAMQHSLVQAVTAVRQGSEHVASSSTQIAQGNQDLSSRTEHQASALQQTAATMDQLGSTVRNNADNAKQANQLALGASSVAVEGGEVVGQVVATMKDINESSRKIADIIAVIDGIAFQTNILALNAAVEAARAGEQGRGFAVVAGEVRSLAQRSAEAAREIKGLIGTSVERVERGTALVDRAGQTMEEIVNAIRRVSDIVGEISSASVEQSSGVEQVGRAVTDMDQATQQNAALVEQSAAAAESLQQQAQQLVQAVAVFKLAQGAARAEIPAPALNLPKPAAVAPKAAAKPVVARPPRTKPVKPASVAPAVPKKIEPVAAGDDWQSF